MITLILTLFFGTTIYIENEPIETRIVEVTGYSSEVSQTDSTPHLTASQTKVRDGVIACPRDLEFGTKVIIDGKEFICEDRMNIRYTNRFDVWFETTEQALEWGKQTKLVRIN